MPPAIISTISILAHFYAALWPNFAPPLTDSDYFILLGTIDQKQQTTYRVRVHHVTSDWKFLEHAYSAGHEVPMAVVDRIAGINVAEIVDLPLTRAEIEQIAVTSWQVKLIGQRGDLVVSVPAPMVRAFLNVFDQQMRAQNPAS